MNQTLMAARVGLYSGHTGSVYSLVAGEGHRFFTGGGDRMVVSWRNDVPDDGQLVARIPQVIYSMLHLEHEHRMLVGQATGGIHVIQTVQQHEERLLQYHTAPVFHLGKSNTHQLIFSLTGDGEMGVMNLSDFSLLRKIKILEGKLRTAALNSDESLLAVGGSDGSITLFELPSLKRVMRLQAHQESFSVNALCFSPGDKWLLSGGRDAHLNAFDAGGSFERIRSVPAHNYAIYGITYSPDRKLFATGSRDKTVKIWDATTLEVLLRIESEKHDGHVNSVNRVLWMDDGTLVSAGDDRSIMLWKISEAGEP